MVGWSEADRECTELGQMETAPFSCSAPTEEKRDFFIFRALFLESERLTRGLLKNLLLP